MMVTLVTIIIMMTDSLIGGVVIIVTLVTIVIMVINSLTIGTVIITLVTAMIVVVNPPVIQMKVCLIDLLKYALETCWNLCFIAVVERYRSKNKTNLKRPQISKCYIQNMDMATIP